MELLSPAGNSEALRAAVQNGADAVYLGYTSFGARSYAGNFDREELRAAIRYCHERGKRVYVTVNTLVKDQEMDDAADVLELLCTLHADAAIVQDLGLARLCRERFPDLALHASTQMTIHNAQGVALLRELGFSRLVPARECPLDEIRRICAQGLETEVFVHGALCVSVSGQCLMSSMLGGRSGNRGRCAQPCRMPYRQADGTQGYLLSPRDLMLLRRLPLLQAAGVHSLKIEGRMKRPEYVAVVTAAYRRALDCALRGEPYVPDEKTLRALEQIFNRGGFTEGYLMGNNNAALMSWQRPNHQGLRIGTVTGVRGALCMVRLDAALQGGDALVVRGGQELDTTYAGPGVEAGGEAKVRVAQAAGGPACAAPCPGDAVYRLTDAAQMEEARRSYAEERNRIPVRARLCAAVGELPVLTVTDGTLQACAEGKQRVAAAQNRPLDAEGARRQLEKTGDTPYVLSGFQMEGEGAFLPVSTLNALRRDALATLSDLRCRRPAARILPAGSPDARKTGERLLIAQTARLSWADRLLGAGADWIYWSPDDMRPARMASELDSVDQSALRRVLIVLPQVAWTDELAALHAFVQDHAARIGGVALNNPAQLALRWGVSLVADTGMNAFNARTAAFLFDRGCERVTLSPELNLSEIRDVLRPGGGFELVAYGRAQLMLLSHCTDCVKRGMEEADAGCERCAVGAGELPLIDRKGFVFPLMRLRLPHGCMRRLYNSVPTDLTRHMDRLRTLPVSLRLQFTFEDAALCADVTRHYRALMDGRTSSFAYPGETTAGHLKRGAN